MQNQAFRNFALDLLDDEHGVNSSAWKTLGDMLYDNEDHDIVDKVEATNGRFYLKAEDAHNLRKVIKPTEPPDDET